MFQSVRRKKSETHFYREIFIEIEILLKDKTSCINIFCLGMNIFFHLILFKQVLSTFVNKYNIILSAEFQISPKIFEIFLEYSR